MSRLLLLGLNDEDVDVLSLVSELEPQPEILVVHSDPGALIMKLADLADLPATTVLPEPEEGDVVVVPKNGDRTGDLVSGWRKLGARIVRPGELMESMGIPPAGEKAASRGETKRTRAATAGGAPGKGRKAAKEPPESAPETASTPQPTETTMKTHATKETPTTLEAVSPEKRRSAKVGLPPDEVWIHPEATFRYLVEIVAGKERAMTLWWDGNTGVWVPWLWTGEIPQGTPEDAENGLEVSDSWGSFRIVGGEDAHSRLNLAALGRVAEDLALRDLAQWRRTAGELADVGYPDAGDEDAVTEWAEQVITPLRSEAALIWVQEEDSWRLLGTWGEGIVFRGNLVVSESLFHTIFEERNRTWFRWDLPEGICVQLVMGDEDPRWPLRLHRVQRAMNGESGGW